MPEQPRARRPPRKRNPAGLLTRRALALQLTVHMMTVTKWEQEGLPVASRGRKGKPSLYDEAVVRAWLAARDERAASGEQLDLTQERARKEHWQALLTEQTHQVRARKLLDVDEVAKIWTAEVSAIRATLLAVPVTYADRVFRAATLEGVASVERLLKEIVYQALRGLAAPTRATPQRPRRRKKAA